MRYARWIAAANPIVMIVIGSLLSRVLPPPFSIWLDGAGLNLGMLFFMALSTKLPWHDPASRATPLTAERGVNARRALKNTALDR